MVNIYTSQFRYNGPNRYDITAKSKSPFSPKWSIVKDYKDGKINEYVYELNYKQQMLESYYSYYDRWRDVLNSDKIVFVCYCKPHTFCHRYLLTNFFIELGAQYLGEI